MTIGDALELARDLCNSGQLSGAAELCSKILSVDPGHPGTLHLLGVIAYQKGNREAAMQWFQMAARRRDFAAACNDLGNVLIEEGRTAEAIAEYKRAIQIAPDFPEAHNNLGNAWQIAGRLEESVRCYQRSLSLSPRYAEAHRNQGARCGAWAGSQKPWPVFRQRFWLNQGMWKLYANAVSARDAISV